MPSLSQAQCLIVPGQVSDGTRAEAAGPDPLLERIAALEALSITQLRSRWAEAHGRPPPAYSHRQFLVRGLAQALQEQALGGLAPALRRRLARLAVTLEGRGGDPLFAAPPDQARHPSHPAMAWRGPPGDRAGERLRLPWRALPYPL